MNTTEITCGNTDPHCSGFLSSVLLFQFSSSFRISSKSGLPPSLEISVLASASSSSRVCLVWLKDPNFSSNVIQYFFTSTSRVRCRSISEWLQLRLIFKCSVRSQDHTMFWCDLILCNCNITSPAFMQHHCTRMHIYNHLWSHSFFTYTVRDQALQL